MNTRLFSSFVAALIFASVVTVNRAQAFEQKRTQFVISLAVERPIAESDLGWRANIFSFQAPGVIDSYFFYAGPTYQKKLGNWDLWTSLQIAAVANFFPDHDALGPAFWVSLSNRWSKVFLEPEAYFSSEGRKGYYGYYSVDFKPVPWLGLGPQFEQIYNDGWGNKFGPHVSASKDIVTCSAAWFVDPDKKFQQYRFTFGVSF